MKLFRLPVFSRIFRARMTATVAALAVSACILNPSAPTPDAASRHAVDVFSLSGRLSASDGTQSATARLEWLRRHETDRWTLFSPLGQIVARIDAGPDGAELLLSNGERRTAPRTADLVPMLLPGAVDAGLPPERLAAWVQAAPPPDAEVRALDALGRPARLVDQGWIVEYLGYQSETPEAPPRLVDISRGEFRLRLVIDRWETETGTP